MVADRLGLGRRRSGLESMKAPSITNDIAYCRETFVVNGAVCTNAVSYVLVYLDGRWRIVLE